MDNRTEVEQHTFPQDGRLSMCLMAFWWERRGERRFPTLEGFDPEMLAEVWPNCFMLAPRSPPQRSVFQYIGEMIGESSGVTGRAITVDEVTKDSLLDHATREIGEVLEQKIPAFTSGVYTDPEGCTVLFRSALLPLSSDQSNVDCLIGGARCKFQNAA